MQVRFEAEFHALAQTVRAGAFRCPGVVVQGSLCDECAPRARFGDGRICRDCAARLGGVKPDTISSWVTRGKVKNVRYEGKRPWFWPAEIIEVEWSLHARERNRMQLLASLVPDPEGAMT